MEDKRGVWVRILETRHDYPPVIGTDEERRYISDGDLTEFTDEDAAAYVKAGLVEYYDRS